MSELFKLFLMAGVLIGFYAVYQIGRTYGEMKQRITSLEKQLEERQPKAHTHGTIACLEDAIACLIDAEFTADELQARIRTGRRILGEGRQGPHSYDSEQPAWKRK